MKIVIILGIGILISYVLLSNFSREAPDGGSGNSPSMDAQLLVDLRHQLQQETQAREQLKIRLEALQARVVELEHARGDETSLIVTSPDRNAQATNTPADTTELVRSSVQALIDAGISEEQASFLQGRLDDIELQQLYLRDRATREGWLNKPRYHKERQQYLNAVTALREEVDDDVYDRLLYALGRANRVVILDTLNNSVAAQYGLQSGDRIIEYAGQRIFNSNEISPLATKGSAGMMTLVRVEREGAIQDIYLPRGPLGIRMSAARIAP